MTPGTQRNANVFFVSNLPSMEMRHNPTDFLECPDHKNLGGVGVIETAAPRRKSGKMSSFTEVTKPAEISYEVPDGTADAEVVVGQKTEEVKSAVQDIMAPAEAPAAAETSSTVRQVQADEDAEAKTPVPQPTAAPESKEEEMPVAKEISAKVLPEEAGALQAAMKKLIEEQPPVAVPVMQSEVQKNVVQPKVVPASKVSLPPTQEPQKKPEQKVEAVEPLVTEVVKIVTRLENFLKGQKNRTIVHSRKRGEISTIAGVLGIFKDLPADDRERTNMVCDALTEKGMINLVARIRTAMRS